MTMHKIFERLKNKFRFISISILMSLSWNHAIEAAAPPIYDVELIVFTNNSSSDGGERWTRPNSDAIRPSGFFPENNFTELATAHYTLNSISQALESSGRHNVLFHRAWRQLAYDKSRAVAYPVHSIAENRRDSIEGIIKLVRGRFLHLDVNLQLMTSARGTEVMFSDSPNSRPAFELIETRRIKSNVLHYFDHPRLGVIARVTPYISNKASAPEEQQGITETSPENEAETDLPNPNDNQLTR